MARNIENYSRTFDPAKCFERMLYRDGYVLQGRELNDEQEMSAWRLKQIADAILTDGDIIRDAQITVNDKTGEVNAQSGAIYLNGAVRGVAPATFIIPTTGTVAVGIRMRETIVSEMDDPGLRNPAQGVDGEGEPGAWRLRVETFWGHDGDGALGEFFPVHLVDNGVVRAKEQPPALNSFNAVLERYDRDSTGGGSYIASGLKVQRADDTASAQIYTVSEGRCRVNGAGVDLPTSRRLAYPAVPDLRRIDTEIHVARGGSAERILVAHGPIHSVESLRVLMEKTVVLTHGSYPGCSDTLPDTSVRTIERVWQGDTVYEAGSDYTKVGDKIDWGPQGAEPDPGSTYHATIRAIVVQTPDNLDADGFDVHFAVSGSDILVTYQQALPRLDRLCITCDGTFTWLKGIAAENNLKAPSVPDTMLALATVAQTWRPERPVSSDGVRVIPFSSIEALNRRVEYLAREVARQRLEADVSTRENGTRAGIFVDPLLNDDMRDQGIEQSAAIIDGELTLPIAATAFMLSGDVRRPTARAFTPQICLAQTLRTGEMRVNPYSAFDPMPARVTLSPAIDRWTETKTRWTSGETRHFNRTRDGYYHIAVGKEYATSNEMLAQNFESLEYLRPIEVSFKIEGFGSGEELRQILFDGIPVEARAKA